MSYAVRFTDTAKEDLRDIAFWIAEKSQDVDVARQFVRELRKKCMELEVFPNGGGIPKDRVLKSAGFRFVVYKDYLIFYLVDEDKKYVNVMAVFNARRDYMRVMKKYI